MPIDVGDYEIPQEDPYDVWMDSLSIRDREKILRAEEKPDRARRLRWLKVAAWLAGFPLTLLWIPGVRVYRLVRKGVVRLKKKSNVSA